MAQATLPARVSRRRLLLAAGGCTLLPPLAAAVPASPLPEVLPGPLRRIVEASGLPLDSFGLQVQAVQGRAAPLVSLNAELPYQLASTTKLVTALAALDLLGPRYRWRTAAFLDGPLQDGRLLGDLLIVGGGNALLRSDDLQAWFTQMRAAGLHEVAGDIVLDRQAFQLHEQDFAGTPLPAVDRPHHAWPDALSLDEGRLRVSVQASAGARAQVLMWPPLADVKLDSGVRQGACGIRAQWQDLGPASAAIGPTLTVRGAWSAHCGPGEIWLSPLPPNEYMRRAVQGLWQASGGRLRGRVRSRAVPVAGSLPAGPADGEAPVPWSVHQSEALPQLLRDINKSSNNFAARNLMLSLAPGFPARAATLAHARERLAAWLRRQGLGPDDLWVDNGSGLSRAERGKPRAMVQLLRRGWASPHRPALVDSLPVAGIDGTLAHRMTHGPATGQAFLKTGSLLDTRALAGYVNAASGRTYAVAALVNHAEAARATPALDGLIEWVAGQG